MNRKVSSRIILTLLLISALTMISPRFAAAVDADVAVTNVVTFKTVSNASVSYTLIPFDVIYENYSVSINAVGINATVLNQGGDAVGVDVTAKYDSNPIGSAIYVELDVGESKNVTFTWNTNGVARGSYNITVEAVLAGDATPEDNTKTYGPVKVTWLGDQDGNIQLDPDDFWYLCAYFITYYKPGMGYLDKTILYDLNEDCIMNEDDLFLFSESWIYYYTTP